MTSLFSAERIFALSELHPDQITIQVVAETGSTNADLLARIQTADAADTLATPALLIAEQQTAGRGRAGRTWLSAPSAALMFSLAWDFDQPLQKLVGLPLAVGVAIVTSLNAYLAQVSGGAGTDAGIRLKWPNDLLLAGAKLGGILIETTSANCVNSGRSAWAVIGVGINLTMPDDLQQQLGRSIANLPVPADFDRDALMAELLRGLTHALQQFQQHGLGPFVARWNQLHAHAGQQVVILDQGEVLHEGTALGIDGIGRFLLQTTHDDHPIAIMAGDISLRAKDI